MFIKRKPRLSAEQVLLSRPVRHPNVQAEPMENGGLRILIEGRLKGWMKLLGLIFPIPQKRAVELDMVGKQVWELCDGEHTVRELIGIIQKEHKLTRAEADWSLRTYLRNLGKRGLVGFAVEKRVGQEGAQPYGEHR